MALPNDLDLPTAIEELNKHKNTYSLSSSVPPHTITSWDSGNSDAQPTEAELITAWNGWKAKHTSMDWLVFRARRDERLADSDWMATPDRTMTDAQKKYRQDLRDLPANTSDPNNPTWPTEPT